MLEAFQANHMKTEIQISMKLLQLNDQFHFVGMALPKFLFQVNARLQL